MTQVMGIRQCTCCDEFWVLYGRSESLFAHLKLMLHCMLTHRNLNKSLLKSEVGNNDRVQEGSQEASSKADLVRGRQEKVARAGGSAK